MFENLFTPIKVRDMEMRNRIIMPAMGTRMCENSYVTQRLIDYHAARAKGGCALNIVEVSSVHTPSAPSNFVSISEDCYIEGHKKLCDAIHAEGGKAGIQLWQGSIAVGMDPKAKMFVVNDMPVGKFTLPAITKEEIEEIVKCYGEAARRSVEAGYDCIEFHCAHNYLPHSFLSAGINHRTDEYGGSFANRVRFPIACIKAIRENMPEGMPLFMRIDAMDDNLPNGMSIEDTIMFCKLAKDYGVDVLDVSRGNIITAASVYEVPPIDIPQGFNIKNAAKIRKETGMLTVGVGRINNAKFAEKLLSTDKVDMVVMGRAQLADPEFANKAKAGCVDDIVHCIGCNQGCYDGFTDMQNYPFITCLRNPMLGREKEYALEKALIKKKVLIIGGGVAGLEAAKILKQRDHEPVIYEASDHLGGQFITAGLAPGKVEMAEATVSLARQVEKMGVEIHLNTKVDETMLDSLDFDEAIIAVGASPIMMGLNAENVVSAHDVLNNKKEVKGNIVVIGGGLVGLEVADYLASNNNSVTVIEMLEKAGKDLGSLRSICVMQKMAQLKVNISTNTKFVSLCEDGVLVDKDGTEEKLVCDYIVVAVGSKANDSTALVAKLEARNIKAHVIGDAKKARRALNAIHEAFDVARKM